MSVRDAQHNALLLAGDIGATKTTLALYAEAPSAGPAALVAPLREESFLNRNFACFDDVLAIFLGAGNPAPPFACIGVAGPVLNDAANMTNLRWRLDARALEQRHGFTRARLLNDLVATALFVPCLGSTSLGAVNTGAPRPGPLAVIAPGTGLGEAFLVPRPGGGWLPCASEGGHVSFAPRNAEQMDLLAFMLQQQDHVSVEDVCSGRALPRLFAFMGTRHTVPDWLDREIEQAEDPTPVIVAAAQRAVEGKRVCGVAVQTMRLLCDILADEAANLVLKSLAVGGVYLGGGFALRLRPFLRPEQFLRIFTRDRKSSLLTQTPVHFILDKNAALHGAAEYGLRVLARSRRNGAVAPGTPAPAPDEEA